MARRDHTRVRTIFVVRKVSASVLVVVRIRRQDTPQMALVEDYEVVQTFAPDRPDDSFNIGILPR